jgi:hypothetical protein
MKTYLASELFLEKLHTNDPLNILNTEFSIESHTDTFEGPGLYFMYYEKELVYIGYFFGSEKKDVRKERWTKELETISMRGRRVGFNETSFRELQKSKNININKPKIKDTGCVTSKKRIQFADKNWAVLSQHPNSWLHQFSFTWIPNTTKRTEMELQNVTNTLIEFYKPTCNGKKHKLY